MFMSSPKNYKLIVYYDGLCRICHREIMHYLRLSGSERIDWQDISEASFDAAGVGLDPVAVTKNFHARTCDGRLLVGVEAFIAIWELLPRYGWLARLAARRPVNYLLKIGYRLFVRIRPYLPRKKASCDDNRCQI